AAGHGEAGGGADRALEAARGLEQVAVQALGAREVAVGLVEVGLDRGRDRAAAGEDLLGEAAVDLGVALEDHGLGAQEPGFAERHAGLEAEGARLVGARGDHARPHDHGLALEARVALLLDGGEERVDVDVEHGGRRRRRDRHRWLHPSTATESSHHTISPACSWSWYTSPLSTVTEKQKWGWRGTRSTQRAFTRLMRCSRPRRVNATGVTTPPWNSARTA